MSSFLLFPLKLYLLSPSRRGFKSRARVLRPELLDATVLQWVKDAYATVHRLFDLPRRTTVVVSLFAQLKVPAARFRDSSSLK